MQCHKFIRFLLFALLATGPLFSYSQVIPPATESSSPGDSSVDVNILSSRHLTILKVNDSTSLQILAGGVRLKQGNSLFSCDSCVINSNTKTFEAWGNVHINDADTANIY